MILTLLAAAATVAAPVRVPVATYPLGQTKAVSRVEVMRATVAPHQAIGRHLHPVPVVCFVESGEFVGKIGNAPEARFKAGGASFEPANAVVAYYRNVSDTPGTLVCAFLAGEGDQELSRTLPEIN